MTVIIKNYSVRRTWVKMSSHPAQSKNSCKVGTHSHTCSWEDRQASPVLEIQSKKKVTGWTTLNPSPKFIAGLDWEVLNTQGFRIFNRNFLKFEHGIEWISCTISSIFTIWVFKIFLLQYCCSWCGVKELLLKKKSLFVAKGIIHHANIYKINGKI